ncbi:MAG TPA: CoA pyrophosphatase [Solirubrobacteraceae bacterium]|nr:CoA pyrophosphatase [Solirubrobacteraceae bacterium]
MGEQRRVPLRALLAGVLDPLAEGLDPMRAPASNTLLTPLDPAQLQAPQSGTVARSAAELAREPPVHAAVMVVLVPEQGVAQPCDLGRSLRVILTLRRADLRRHAGEVSLPGGRRERHDADLLQTALRESEEELGLERSRLTPLGALAPARTIATNYLVSPFVSLLALDDRAGGGAAAARPPASGARRATQGAACGLLAALQLRPQPGEVAAVLAPTLAEISSGRGERQLTRRGISFRTPVYAVGEQIVWGLTYRVLSDLLERLLARAPDRAREQVP